MDATSKAPELAYVTSGRVFSEGAKATEGNGPLDKAEEKRLPLAAAVPTKSPLSRISQVD